jgi:hypothetical protein
VTQDDVKNLYFRETQHMAIKKCTIARWDRMTRQQREEEHARFEAACSWIDRQKA